MLVDLGAKVTLVCATNGDVGEISDPSLATPENLHIVNGGLRYRPRAIQAITPGWGGQRLRQQETQLAVYAFDPGIELEIALTVEYEDASDTSWQTILNRLEAERARVRARVGAS